MTSDSIPSINDNYKTLDTNDPQQFMKYINEEPPFIYMGVNLFSLTQMDSEMIRKHLHMRRFLIKRLYV